MNKAALIIIILAILIGVIVGFGRDKVLFIKDFMQYSQAREDKKSAGILNTQEK